MVPDSLPPLTLLDAAILLAALLSVLSACRRGIAREMLHTVLFGAMLLIGYLLLRGQPAPDQSNLAFWVANISYYVVTAYALTWLVLTVTSPLVMGPHEVGYRSRFWAGALSLVKVAAMILGVNLWFAVHSPFAHPARLQSLPHVMQDSIVVQQSDALTEQIYLWLAGQGMLTYDKHVEYKPPERKPHEGEHSLFDLPDTSIRHSSSTVPAGQ